MVGLTRANLANGPMSGVWRQSGEGESRQRNPAQPTRIEPAPFFRECSSVLVAPPQMGYYLTRSR